MKTYEWTVKITATADLVADGFELTHGRAYDMLCRAFPRTDGNLFNAEVISAPDPDEVAQEQGYKDAEQKIDSMRHQIWDLQAELHCLKAKHDK